MCTIARGLLTAWRGCARDRPQGGTWLDASDAPSKAAGGGGGTFVLVTSDLMSRVPISRTSAAGGLTAAAQSLAHIVASPLVGMTIDRTHGYDLVMVTLGIAVIPTSLAFVLWPSLRKA